MSVDEVKAEADRILLEYAKGNEIKFSIKESENKTVGKRVFPRPTANKATGKSRYGGVFSK